MQVANTGLSELLRSLQFRAGPGGYSTASHCAQAGTKEVSLMNTAVVVWLGIMAVIGLIMVVVKMKKKS